MPVTSISSIAFRSKYSINNRVLINRSRGVVQSYSNWSVPEISWGQEVEEQSEQAKQEKTTKRHKDSLRKSVNTAVRGYLNVRFGKAFSSKCSTDLWQSGHKQISQEAKILLTFNGFKRVAIPTPSALVDLAEGVVAYPNFYSRIPGTSTPKYLMYSQKIQEWSPADQTKVQPAIVEEDIQLYRILESQAEVLLNSVYHGIRQWAKRRIQQPIELMVNRIDRLIGVKHSPPSKAISSEVALVEVEPLENLLVMGKKETVLVTHMTESVRLVALPYALGHKSASTLVSVSLVVFGALPLAYRSINFAFAYPGLKEALVASVVLTVSWGIMSQRMNARTSQSRVVSNALLHRIYARDDAALLVLQEGAVQAVSQALLSQYYQHLSEGPDGDELSSAELEGPVLPENMVRPLELAKTIGLLKSNGDSKELIAVPLQEASSVVDAATRRSLY